MKNVHKVPTKQWNRWSEQAQRAFSELYFLGIKNQEIFTHPQMMLQKQEHWNTIAWNFAWLAADAVDEFFIDKGDPIEDIDTETGTVVKTRKVN